MPILFKKKYDVVIAVSPPMQVGLMPWIYNKLRGTPWVFHIQDLQVDAAVRLGMINQGKIVKLLYNIENFLLKRATKVSTITEAMRTRLHNKGVQEENTLLFPNWSDINFITPLSLEGNSYRKELRVSSDQVIFMYAGNIGEKQGLDIILEVAEQFKEDSRARFVIAGEGAAKSKLLKKAESLKLNNVNFLPIQPLEKLPQLLAAGDVHLVIQKSEAADLVMPSKLTNILAAGRPAIATAESGTALYEVLHNHNAGKTGSSDDKQALMKNIEMMIENVEERKQMGINARKAAEILLDKNKILRDFEVQLQNLIKK